MMTKRRSFPLFHSHVCARHLKTVHLSRSPGTSSFVPPPALIIFTRHSFVFFFVAHPSYLPPHRTRILTRGTQVTIPPPPPPKRTYLSSHIMSPRTARPIVLATLALGVVGFLCWGPSFGGPSSQYYRDLYDGWHSPGAGSGPPTLAERLRNEEARYSETLKGRQWLIEKHGPRKEEVKS